MFKEASSSPFSALDGKRKGQTATKSKPKQATLKGFFNGVKQPKGRVLRPFLSSGPEGSVRNKHQVTLHDVNKENKLPRRERDTAKEKHEHLLKKVHMNRSASFAGQTSFSESVEAREQGTAVRNFKHMDKPMTRQLMFGGAKMKQSHSSIRLSNSNQLSAKRPLSLSQPITTNGVIQHSKRRQLPWQMKSMSNPRLHERSSQEDSTRTNSSGLSKEQEDVLDAIMFGHKNVFFTGSAGTGKSFLLRTIIRRLRARYGIAAVGVCASTGLAATNIDGTTINRFAGIGLGLENAVSLTGKIRNSRSATDRWKVTKFLIVDELSMIDATMFTKLNEIAKMIRGSERPFGGIQLILTGDFFQLPPVSRNGDADFCFNCPAWKECIQETYLLTRIFRQSGDSDLIDMLNALRLGRITPYIRDQFKALERPVEYKDGILPTELYPTREEVERANRNRLAGLPGEELTFHAIDSLGEGHIPGQKPPPYLVNMLNNLMCSRVLRLKEGAQVMNIKNDLDDTSIVNGTIGKIVCFTTEDLWNYFCASVNEYERVIYAPLLVYASKFIGNSGADLDNTLYEEMIASNSACMSKTDLLPDLVRRAKRENKKDRFPLVKFTVNTSDGYKLRLIQQMDFGAEGRHDVVRTQLPIILSWALSIHKSQGQTLNRVKVDLTKVFEKGQVYVALSRCVSTKGLEIVNFNENKIQVRKDVLRFYAKLKKQQSARET